MTQSLSPQVPPQSTPQSTPDNYPNTEQIQPAYTAILKSMFDRLPVIIRGDKRQWPVKFYASTELPRGDYILMEDFFKPFERAYSENNIPDYLAQCQPIGGFRADIKQLMSGEGNPSKIFERLAKISSENLVAISEAGISEPVKYNNLMIRALQNQFLHDKPGQTDVKKYLKYGVINGENSTEQITFNDTGFIGKFSKNDREDIPAHINYKCINIQGIKILNCHFDSKGPNGIKDKDKSDEWKKNVENFLSGQFPPDVNNQLVIDVIMGDLNVTESKSKPNPEVPITRDELLESILKGITQKFSSLNGEPITRSNQPKKTWVLITSDAKINKPRAGFLLLNNQAYKSNQTEIIEADGTIIAIRSYIDNLSILNNTFFCEKNFGKNYHICYKNGSEPYKHIKSSTTPVVIDFLTFNGSPQTCMNNNMPIDDIFIDHSVVAVSKHALLKLISLDIPKYNENNVKHQWSNLVVLNLGSIINSKNPWNIELFQGDALAKISIADQWLFSNFFPELMTDEKNKLIYTSQYKYDDYSGPLFGKLLFTQAMIPVIAEAMGKVHLYLEGQLPKLFPTVSFDRFVSNTKPLIQGQPQPSQPNAGQSQHSQPTAGQSQYSQPNPGQFGGYYTKKNNFKTKKIKKNKTKKRKTKNKITKITSKMNKRKTYKY